VPSKADGFQHSAPTLSSSLCFNEGLGFRHARLTEKFAVEVHSARLGGLATETHTEGLVVQVERALRIIPAYRLSAPQNRYWVAVGGSALTAARTPATGKTCDTG
jgi:hypothetical protein